MQLIPDDILAQYEDALKKWAIPVARYTDYRKWLRYYLDFRSKYPLPDSKLENVIMNGVVWINPALQSGT